MGYEDKVVDVNTENLKEFLIQILITNDWSDKHNDTEYFGIPYWKQVYKWGLIKESKGSKYYYEVSSAGRKWLDEQSREFS